MSAEQMRLFYSSPNGDTWFLCHEDASDRTFVKHRANPASGGHETDTEIDDFLGRGSHNPEHAALARLMEAGAAPRAKSAHKPTAKTRGTGKRSSD